MADTCDRCGTTIDDGDFYCEDCESEVAGTWMCSCCDYQNENEDYYCQGSGCNCTR